MLDILEVSDLSLHLTQTGRPLLEHFSFTLGAGDRAALEEVIAEIEALPEANRAYVTGAGGLYAARERLDRTQTGRTVGIIAAAAAVIAAAAIVLIIIKKKKAASHTEEIKTKETGK